jgi:hypothetical protein
MAATNECCPSGRLRIAEGQATTYKIHCSRRRQYLHMSLDTDTDLSRSTRSGSKGEMQASNEHVIFCCSELTLHMLHFPPLMRALLSTHAREPPHSSPYRASNADLHWSDRSVCRRASIWTPDFQPRIVTWRSRQCFCLRE